MRRTERTQRGASLVEAALVIPLLGVLLLGIIECAYLMASYITLRNASASAARAAILFGATDNDIRNAARNAIDPMLNPGNLPDGNINIVRDTSFDPPRITVSLSYNLSPVISYAALGQLGAWQLTAATTMR